MKNIYSPTLVKIISIQDLSHNVKLFRLKLQQKFSDRGNGMGFMPGQFGLVGVWGYGEAPFGLASDPYQKDTVEIIVRRVGTVTEELHRLKIGDEVTFRGPIGNGFPLGFFEGKDVIMVTGGCGIPPIASLIEYIIRHRERFNKVYLLYGAATPADVLLKKQIEFWKKHIEIFLTVDCGDSSWHDHVGLVSDLVVGLDINPQNVAVAMCGPGPMTKAIESILKPLGVADRRIFVSEERRMQCGIGKCQHCTCGEKYVCVDGPVFNFDEIDKNFD